MGKSIALIGCGTWGRKILSNLIRLSCNVSVYENDITIKDSILSLGAKDFQIGLPSQKAYDGIIIATPASSHKAVMESVLSLDLPIFLEKPLTAKLTDALFLKNIVHSEVFLMHIWIYHPGIQMLRDIAQSGELGKVKGLKSTRVNWTSPRKDIDSVWNLSPHDVTIAKAILGKIPKPKSAVAERHNGVIRSFTALLGNDPYCIFEVSNRYERKLREVRVHCEKGVVFLKDEKVDYVTIVKGDDNNNLTDKSIELRNFDSTSPLYLELQEFINYLNGGPPPKSNFEDGLDVVRIIHQLVELSK